MRARTQAKPVSRKKKNEEQPVTAMNSGTKAFPAVQPVQQHKNGVAQLYRTNTAHAVSDDLELASHRIRKDSDFSQAYETLNYSQIGTTGDFSAVGTEAATGKMHQVFLPGLPPLKISENNQMAVVDDGTQHHEFFTTPQLLGESNNKLNDAAANVRLGTEGGSLKLTEGGDPLFRTVPLSQPIPQGNWVKLDSLSTSYCNKVTDQLIGASSRIAVFSRTLLEQEDREETEVPMKQKHNDPTWIRNYLSTPEEERPPFETLGEHYLDYFHSPPNELEETVKNYNDLDPELRKEQAEVFGLNEFAMAEPGEAYMTSSMGSPEYRRAMMMGVEGKNYFKAMQELKDLQPGLDIAQQEMSAEAQSLIDSWSYHFATVVARDGADSVTLENYNRSVENENVTREIFHKLFDGFGEFRELVQEKMESVKDNIRYGTGTYKELIQWMAVELPQLKKDLSKNAKIALAEALESVNTGLNEGPEYQNKLLYFEMYGKGDQSLHETFKKTGFNPITLRVRESFEPDKKKYTEMLHEAENEHLQVFKHYKWQSGTCNRLMPFMFEQINTQLQDNQMRLQQVTNMRQMNEWKATFQPMLPQALILLNNTVNRLVPYSNVRVFASFTEMQNDLVHVNNLNKENTTFTFESTLRKKYNNVLILSNYNIEDKGAYADLLMLPHFINNLQIYLRKVKL